MVGLVVGFWIRGWRRVGLGIFKVGGVGSGSNLTPWILCYAVRTISWALRLRVASSASFCARDAHKCFVPLCIWMLSYHNTFAQ